MVPVILGNVADRIGTQRAMVVPLAFFLVAWAYPIYLNIYKRRELDAYTESAVGTSAEGTVDFDSIIATKDIEAGRFEHKA